MADAVAYARVHNPDIRTARLQIDSAYGEQRIARAIPNPSFSLAPGNPTQYSVVEPLDVGPNRVYRTRAARQGAAATTDDAANAARQAVFAVRQAFLDDLLAEAARGVAFEQDTITRRLLASDSLRFREGDLARRDLNTTELQFAHAEAALARADAAARVARTNLQLLMGVEQPDTAFRASGTLEYRAIELPSDLHSAALARRPDLRAANLRVEQSRSLQSLAGAMMVPVPGLAAVYQAQPFETGRNYALGLSLNLPVFYWFAGERQRAAAGYQSASVARARVAASIEADVQSSLADFRAAQTLAARYANGLLAKARETLDMQRYAYEHGNAALLDLLNAINAFGDTQTDYYTAVHDYLVAAYAIDRAAGEDVALGDLRP
jgi:outer membrane protein TolC